MSAMLDCPEIDFWPALLDEALSAEQRAPLERHLEMCPYCQERIDRAQDTQDSLRNLGRRFGDPTIAPADPILAQVREQLHEVKSPIRADQTEPADLSFLGPASKPDLLGMLGAYEVREVIGQGGMGVVLKAYEPALNRVVAIKVMAPFLVGSATARKRFIREAHAAAAVSHDHVVAVHSVSEEAGLPYLVMQYIAGESLQARLDRCGPLEVEQIVRIGLQTAQGLAAAHAQGLIHRDVKPANLLLSCIRDAPDGTDGTDGTDGSHRSHPSHPSYLSDQVIIKITDFGLARMVDDVGLTQHGMVAGTPEYMAPEQARGEAVDHRADLFSLGSVLYAMCTGMPPFRGSSAMAVLRMVSDEEPVAVRSLNPKVPIWLEVFIARLMAKDPAERFGSAALVAELLKGYLDHLRQPNEVSPPELKPSQGKEAGKLSPREPLRGGRKWISPFTWLLIVVLAAAALGVAVLVWFTGNDDPPGQAKEAGQAIPARGRAAFDFRAGIHNFPALTLDAPEEGVQAITDAQGLRITKSAGQQDNRPIQVKFSERIRGDFDISVGYELIAIGRPTPKFGAGVALRIWFDSPSSPSAMLSRFRTPAGELFSAHKTVVGSDGKDKYVKNGNANATSSNGKLRLIRNGPNIQYLVAEPGMPYKAIMEVAIGTGDVNSVDVIGSTMHTPIELDVRLTELVIVADAFPDGLPSARPSIGSAEAIGERWAQVAWAAAVLFVAMLLFGAAGVFLFVRKRRRDKPDRSRADVLERQNEITAAGSVISFACSDCGTRLKARTELMGKKVKCPGCSQAVRVPEALPDIVRKANSSISKGWWFIVVGLASTGLLVGGALLARFTRPAPRSFLDVPLGQRFVPGVEDSGFYNDEENDQGPFRWTDGSAKLEIPLDKRDPPRALFVRLQRPINNWLKIKINDREVLSEQAVNRDMALWERTLDLSGIELGEKLVVEILSNTVVPKNAAPGKSEDPRPLGVTVREVRMLRTANSDGTSLATSPILNVTPGEPFVSGIEETGLHNEERDKVGLFRWTNGKGRLVIPLDTKELPKALLIRLEKPQNRWLRITVNDRVLVNEPVNAQARREWKRTLDLSGIELGEKLVLVIESNTSVPTTDPRPIGVQLRAVKLLRGAGGAR